MATHPMTATGQGNANVNSTVTVGKPKQSLMSISLNSTEILSMRILRHHTGQAVSLHASQPFLAAASHPDIASGASQ